ncbi:MAG: hypothetical protein IT550_04225 [Novosphingobium sp.]|jgi:hypothetical protein|nr:hypothetical protein [Novosphingobium sp.]
MIPAEINLPVLRASGDIIAVVIEQANLAGHKMTVVTAREGASSPPRRRWYPDQLSGLAYAAELADRHGLPLIDLREPGAA